MELPVRCFSCNKVLGNKWGVIQDLKTSGKSLPEIWEHLKLIRECCRFVIQTAIQSVGEEQYEYTNGGTIPICDITTDTIDSRRRQTGVVTMHLAV